MSRTKVFSTLLLTLITTVLLTWHLAEKERDDKKRWSTSNSKHPTYQSETTDTLAYDPQGKLQYQLIASDVKHYAHQGNSWFYQPVLTLFDTQATITWRISAKRAEVTKEKMLYLYGDVKVRSLDPTIQLKTIDTNSAQINLVTQDIASEEQVELGGVGFNSNGLKMRGNLRNKNAELIEKVKTIYEIQQKS